MPSREKKRLETPKQLLKEEPTAGEYIDFPEVPATSPLKPNKQYYVEALAEGMMVGIHAIRQYPTFFKLFQRYSAYHALPMRLYIRQVKPDLWILLAKKKTEPKPPGMLVGDWREHGRYKWYADQLEKGEPVKVDDETEALKVRRAWMLYVPPEERVGREAVIELRGGKYRIAVGVTDESA